MATMKIKQYPSQEYLRNTHRYIGEEDLYIVSDSLYVGGLERKVRSTRAKRSHDYNGVLMNRLGYLGCNFPGMKGLFSLHRCVWIWHHGDIHGLLYVDHINHDPHDNRITNLRLATPSQNQRNRKSCRSDSTIDYIGVTRNANKFGAFVSENSKPIFLGRFDDPVTAALVRDCEARKRYGEFAVLNFPG